MLFSWTQVSAELTTCCRCGDPAGFGYSTTRFPRFQKANSTLHYHPEGSLLLISTYFSCFISRGLVIFHLKVARVFFFFNNLCAYYLLSLGFILFPANETSASLTMQKIKQVNSTLQKQFVSCSINSCWTASRGIFTSQKRRQKQKVIEEEVDREATKHN